eukprot:9656711-Alexandrium_andersonii.AAC.1
MASRGKGRWQAERRARGELLHQQEQGADPGVLPQAPAGCVVVPPLRLAPVERGARALLQVLCPESAQPAASPQQAFAVGQGW